MQTDNYIVTALVPIEISLMAKSEQDAVYKARKFLLPFQHTTISQQWITAKALEIEGDVKVEKQEMPF